MYCCYRWVSVLLLQVSVLLLQVGKCVAVTGKCVAVTGKCIAVTGKCIASQSKSTFFSISASSLTSKWVCCYVTLSMKMC